MSFLQARVPEVPALSILLIANGELWQRNLHMLCVCVFRHAAELYISLVLSRTNSSLAQDRSMHISGSPGGLGESQVSQSKPCIPQKDEMNGLEIHCGAPCPETAQMVGRKLLILHEKMLESND